MSEFEQTSGPAKNTGLWIAVICVVVVGGCLLVCAGLAAVGLVVPVVARQAKQERQAEQAARNAGQIAKVQATAKARALQPTAAEADDRPATQENADPAAEDAPAKDDARAEEQGSQSSKP